MNRSIKVLILTLIGICFWASILTAQDQWVKLALKSPTQDQYPQANALILLDKKELDFQRDGSWVEKRHFMVKIFNDRGIAEFADPRFKYDKNSEKIKIIRARTIRPDGTTLEVPEKGINILTPRRLNKAPAYLNFREMVISFVGIEKNTVLELEIQRTSKRASMPGKFWGEEVFGAKEPILEKEFTILVPKGVKLKYKMLRSEVTPVIGKKRGKISYTWRFKNLAPIMEEEQMPPLGEVAPKLLFSSLKSWKEFGSWFGKGFFKSCVTNPKMVEKAEELVRGLTSQTERVLSVQQYLKERLRDVPCSLEMAGYLPRPAKEVYQDRYGNLSDRMAVMVAMLKSIGIKAYPAMVNSSGLRVDKEIPCPTQFNDLLVAVPQDKGYHWLRLDYDPCRFGELPFPQDVTTLLIKPERSIMTTTPFLTPEENLSQKEVDLELKADGFIRGKVTYSLSGYFDLRARLKSKKTDEERRSYLSKAVKQISERAKLTDYRLSNLTDPSLPLEMHLEFECPDYALPEGDLLLIKVPRVPFSATSLKLKATLDERKLPYVLKSPLRDKFTMRIEVPEGFQVSYLPAEVKLENAAGSLNLSCEQREGKLYYNLNLAITKTFISPEDYPGLKHLLQGFDLEKNRTIILKKKG